MNTKTMRLPPRRVVTSSTNKRKEREAYDSLKPLPPNPPSHLIPMPPPLPTPARLPKPAGLAQAGSDKPSNQLLAGYLAHEFLTQGTLLGQPWDPTRADPCAEPKRAKRSEEESRRRYVEVSSLLRAGDGAHLPGILNPTQLARLLQ